MVAPPLVTVVVSTFNRAPVLRLAMESIRRQTLGAWEAVVVGDGCTHDTGAVVAAMGDARFRWHNRATNGGSQAFANQDGIALARGDWIAYLGHDDLWLPWHLEEVLARADESGADFLHALCASFTPSGLARVWAAPPPGGDYLAHPFPPSSWLHRREIGGRIGWRDPAVLDRPVDLDFQHRAARSGARFAFSPRLSVLNFPASQFGAVYANDGVPLHAPVARALALAPERLERAILEHLAEQWAQNQAVAALPHIAGIVARGGTPETVASYQQERQANRRFRGLDDLPAPAPPPAIRSAHLVPGSGGGVLRVAASGLTHAPWLLADGVPFDARVAADGVLEADLPDSLMRGTLRLAVQVASGGGVSAPVWARVPNERPAKPAAKGRGRVRKRSG